MPVDGGAGRIRIETGTPLCNPMPLASTGRWIVVSNRKGASSGRLPDPPLKFIQVFILQVKNPYRYPFDSKRFVNLTVLQKCNSFTGLLWSNELNSASFLGTSPEP